MLGKGKGASSKKRISSYNTNFHRLFFPFFLVAWLVVLALAVMNGTEYHLIAYLSIVITAFGITYIAIRPWKLRIVYKSQEGLEYISKGDLIKLNYGSITDVYQSIPFNRAPIIVVYELMGKVEQVSFLPRSKDVFFTAPWKVHPVVEEIKENKHSFSSVKITNR